MSTSDAGGGKRITIEAAEYQTGTVRGRVVDETGSPLAGATILTNWPVSAGEVTSVSGMGPGDLTNSEGLFQLSGLPVGEQISIQVNFSGTGYASSAHSRRFEIRLGTEDIGEILLPRATRYLAGRVIDGAGNPLQGVQVGVNGTPTGYRESMTDAAGRYRLENLVGITEDIFLRRPDEDANPLSFEGALTNQDSFDIVLDAPTHFLAGRIMDAAGNAIEGAHVAFRSPLRGGPRSVETDANGMYRLEGLLNAETMAVHIYHADYGHHEFLVERLDVADADFVPSKPPLPPRSATPRSEPSSRIGKSAPEFEVAKWVNTQPMQLATLRGRYVVLLFAGVDFIDQLQRIRGLQVLQAEVGANQLVTLVIQRPHISLKELQKLIDAKQIHIPIAIDRSSEDGSSGRTRELYDVSPRHPIALIDPSGILADGYVRLSELELALKKRGLRW